MDKYVKESDVIKLVQRYGVGSQDFENYTPEQAERFVISNIKSLPAADVVEVTRCKDCQYNDGNGFCEAWEGVVKPDDFCSYGWQA